jgi:hypothetical protein
MFNVKLEVIFDQYVDNLDPFWNGVADESIVYTTDNGYDYYQPSGLTILFHKYNPILKKYDLKIGVFDQDEPRKLGMSYDEYVSRANFTF